jgi:hypothetical protein
MSTQLPVPQTYALVDMDHSLQALYAHAESIPVSDPNYHLMKLIVSDCRDSFRGLVENI